jgi:hypothetical protein
VIIALLGLALQGGADGWVATPSHPTVGDTIRLERTIAAPAGWRVRAGKLETRPDAEQLGDAVTIPATNGWTLRMSVVAWSPGPMSLQMPWIWRLAPDGTADSLDGGTATFQVASVIPDSVRTPAPQPALGPLRLDRASAIPVIAAVFLASGVLLLLILWRRRAPRTVALGDAVAVDPPVSDARWLSAGEPKAVAARASQGLRRAVAQAIPEAHEALSTAECLAVIEQTHPNAPVRDLRELLVALDQVSFATAHGVDVAPLAAKAHTLARELKP